MDKNLHSWVSQEITRAGADYMRMADLCWLLAGAAGGKKSKVVKAMISVHLGFSIIEAIRQVRRLTGLGLKESKDIVDEGRRNDGHFVLTHTAIGLAVDMFVKNMKDAGHEAVVLAESEPD